MKKFDRSNDQQSDRRDSRGFDRRDRRDRRGAHGSNRRDFGRSDRRSEPLIMHQAVCDKCKKECEVPFKPTSGKPVYCRECFKKKGGSRTNSSGQYEKEFAQINEKLDRILETLEDKKEKKEDKKEKKKDKKEKKE